MKKQNSKPKMTPVPSDTVTEDAKSNHGANEK